LKAVDVNPEARPAPERIEFPERTMQGLVQ